jgi:hypothetical protein
MSKQFDRKINENLRYTNYEISEATGVIWNSCHRNLTVDLNIGLVAPKCVPRLLKQGKKKHSFDVVPGFEKSD